MRTASYFVAGLLLLICVGCIAKDGPLLPISSGDPGRDPLTAEQILASVAETYAKCESYRDTGLVKTLYVTADRKWTDEKPFTTAFVRPDRFRFEYRSTDAFLGLADPEDRYIVWCNGQDVRTWWDIRPGVEKEQSLGMALAGATGVSAGSAVTIPGLLLPDEIKAFPITDLAQLERIEDAEIGNVGCYRVRGTWAFSPATIWIEKKTFLIRRVDLRHKIGNAQAEDTTTYDPVINGKIDDKMLEFDPPKQE